MMKLHKSNLEMVDCDLVTQPYLSGIFEKRIVFDIVMRLIIWMLFKNQFYKESS